MALAFGAAACTADATSEPTDGEPEQAEASESELGVSASIDVPWISQKPELPRGCEVTSLAMLLRDAGVNVDKMTLAQKVKKVPYLENGLQGDPYEGFVGNMYDFAQKGYGVYHGPIKALAEQYLPGRIVDLTGASFDDLLTQHVARNRPVWIVSNATFKPLAASEFQTWQTKNGPSRITWHDHSVVITGFDATTVSFNDPLVANGKNRKLPRKDFRLAWEQMGKQAITYLRAPRPSEATLAEQVLPACTNMAIPPVPASPAAPIRRAPTLLAPFDLTASHAVSWTEVRAGDALNRNVATPNAQRVALFAGWADAARTVACVVPQSALGGAAPKARAYPKATLAELTPVRLESSPGGYRSAPIGADCSVHADGRLYCTNKAGAAMFATPNVAAAEVNHLRTTYSWFECWGPGDVHGGGNTTWYRTIGDDNNSRGWVPAVSLLTTSAFDADPTAQGLRRCAP